MKYILIFSLLFLSGCSVSCSGGSKSAAKEANKPTINTAVDASYYDLQVAEDVKRGVVCYRFQNQSGIFCMKKSDTLQTIEDLKDRF